MTFHMNKQASVAHDDPRYSHLFGFMDRFSGSRRDRKAADYDKSHSQAVRDGQLAENLLEIGSYKRPRLSSGNAFIGSPKIVTHSSGPKQLSQGDRDQVRSIVNRNDRISSPGLKSGLLRGAIGGGFAGGGLGAFLGANVGLAAGMNSGAGNPVAHLAVGLLGGGLLGAGAGSVLGGGIGAIRGAKYDSARKERMEHMLDAAKTGNPDGLRKAMLVKTFRRSEEPFADNLQLGDILSRNRRFA